MGRINMTVREYSETPISNFFIDNYMLRANPVYSLIYIYGARLCAGGGGLSSSELAESLNILESDVENAWKYWERQGLVQLIRNDDQLDVVFLPMPKNDARLDISVSAQKKTRQINLTGPYCPNSSIQQNLDKSDSSGQMVRGLIANESQQERTRAYPAMTPAVVSNERPHYAVFEMERYQQMDSKLKAIVQHAEKTMGKMLTHNDLNIIFGFYDWLRLPAEVIEYLFEYCADRGHRELRYIEKVAVEWADNGVNDVSTAIEYTRSFNREVKDIMAALGGSGQPSASQKRYIDKWINTYSMPVDVIVEACDITSVQIGRPRITYVDKVLSDWYAKDIRTIEDIKREQSLHAANVAELKTASRRSGSQTQHQAQTAKQNKFVNFAQRDDDLGEIERMEQERLLRSVGR
ncbi:MAG: DnaD domain protein [Clostridiales bacterium]|jgi:DnaD/phage-associated family protein|nr:DnaD domain protein [Clostridiales bacterium]